MLEQKAKEVRDALEKFRASVNLTFTEENHRYTCDGIDKIVSVSGIVSRYHDGFDAEEVSMRMCGYDMAAAEALRAEWAEKGRVARLTGNYVHYHLEKYLVEEFNLDKEVREPILEGIDDAMIKKGNTLILAGKAQTEAMKKRGGILVDTEVVMGSPECGYVGQCDCAWLGQSPDGSYKLMLTDWKTNKPAKFSESRFTNRLYYPFDASPDNAVGKYSLQIGLYEKLMLSMLKGSSVDDLEFANSIIVSLRQRPKGKYVEYGLDDQMRQLIYQNDFSYV